MTAIRRPSVRLLHLARTLKELREQAGLVHREVTERTGISQATLSRIEHAATVIRPGVVEQLLDVYGTPNPTRDALLSLARDSGKRGWWQHYSDIYPSGYASLEDEVPEICVFELALIPGLLQTTSYYRALLAAAVSDGELDAEATERRVLARRTRQALLTRPNAPHLHCVIGESALRQQVGGTDVMRGQLGLLAQFAERENVTLQILPFSAGAHVSMDGSFTLLRSEQYLMEIGYIEGPGGYLYLESVADLARVATRWKSLVKDSALSPEESERMIQNLLIS